MDPLARKQFEERLFEEVQQLLTMGDQNYLQGLSRTALLEALENELRFLGLYAHTDRETPEVIRAILEQHLDQWLDCYKEGVMADEQQPIQETRVDIMASPFVQFSATSSSGKPMTEATSFIGFTPTMESLCIDISPIPAHPA